MSKDLFNVGSTKKQIKELITPHKICVAILIRQFCIFRESTVTEPSQFRLLPSTLTPVYRKDFCILILKLIQSPDLSLSELRSLLLCGKYHIDPRFVTKFDTAIRDLHAVGVNNLLDLAEYISRLTIDIHLNGLWCQINKNSILGCYLRRLMIFFDKLTFSEVTAVYEAFVEYYKPCEQDIKARRKYFPKTVDSIDSPNTPDVSHHIQPITLYSKANNWSKRQAELFIATQSVLLSNNEVAAQTPVELNKQIQSLLKSNMDLAEAHFLCYMNLLRVKEYCGAIDSLYHSFDRCAPISESKNNNEEKFRGFRYAALNLAVLHFQFGQKEEALQALKESIRMAQEANDNICLQHALAWKYKLTNTNKELLMQHSILKSKNLNLTYIASLGVQSYAQHLGLAGLTPKYIFEMMVKSDILNCQNTYRDLMSSSYSQKSSLWLIYGKTEMSSLWSQLLLHLNSDCLSTGKIYNGEGNCQAICHMANILLLDGEYKQGLVILKLARKKFPNEPISHNWMICECLFSFVKALNNGDWSSAEVAASQMAAIDKWESCLRMAELYIAKGDFQSAQVCINKVLDICENDPDTKLQVSFKVRAIILLAELHCANAVFNIPTNIVTALNSALSTANVYHLDHLTSIIHMHLANIQLLMGLPSQALKILDKYLVQILTHGGKYDIARAMLLYAKCIVADAGLNTQVDRYSVILQTTEILKKVKENFHKVEARSRVKDVLYLQAQLYNEIEHFEDRNDCALEYKQYTHDYLTKNSRTLLFSF